MARKKLTLHRAIDIGLVIVSLALLWFVVSAAYMRGRLTDLTLAAGSKTGESYILGAALKAMVERDHPEIKITLRETGGTAENLKMLEDGRAELATAQADNLAGASARSLALLYDDTFQLLVHQESPVQTFAGLRRMTIALPQSGGQFQSFLRVAAHFGLQRADFRFVGDTDASADQAFLEGRADALFRVRALGNVSIQRLVETGKVKLMQIDHAAAMKIYQPAFAPAVIPAGAYMGSPAVPAQDLPSIAVHRMLLASSHVDDETIRAITEELIDKRQEMAREIPGEVADVRLLLAQVRRPDLQADMGPALHPGAVMYYDKDKPSFLVEHADYIALLLTVLVLLSSWVWQLRAWLQRRQKNVADRYSKRVLALIDTARVAKTRTVLEEIRGELLAILHAAVGDLDADKLSDESFESFRAILQIGLETVRDAGVGLQRAASG